MSLASTPSPIREHRRLFLIRLESTPCRQRRVALTAHSENALRRARGRLRD
jgi:hypothetical protein